MLRGTGRPFACRCMLGLVAGRRRRLAASIQGHPRDPEIGCCLPPTVPKPDLLYPRSFREPAEKQGS